MADSQEIQNSAAGAETQESTRLRLLLAEDNPANQYVAKEMLEQLGCDVELAVNGLEAFQRLKQESFDLVLMDCQMPVMDGYEATREIRNWEENQRSEPTTIVALTAHALSSDREKCIQAGMNDYLTKPFTISSLVEILSSNLPGTDLQAIAPAD